MTLHLCPDPKDHEPGRHFWSQQAVNAVNERDEIRARCTEACRLLDEAARILETDSHRHDARARKAAEAARAFLDQDPAREA